MNELVGFIYNSDASTWLRTATWAIPLVQTVHLLALAALFGSAILLNMRLAGLLARTDSGAAMVRRYQPVLYVALAVMLVSGAVLIWAEPERVLPKDIFWMKMGLVVAGFASTFAVGAALSRTGEDQAPRGAHKALGWACLALWAAAIFCGRWIAYVY